MTTSAIRRLHCLAACVAMLGLAPVTAASQLPAVGIVRGVAYDSLRSAPLRNAFVAIVGTTYSAHADEDGRFRIDSVPLGSYVIAIQHDVLDSLGLTNVSTRVTLTGHDVNVRIATPSFATMWRRTCGGSAPPADSGIVYGVVRDAVSGAPAASAYVDLTWIETNVDKTHGVTQRRQRYETRTGVDGRYSVCGVPVAHWLRVGAGSGQGAAGPVDLPPSERRVQRRDLLLGPAPRPGVAMQGTIAGTLIDVGGNPIGDARVVVDDSAETRSGPDGRFRLRDVPAGTRQIEIMSLGMRPVVVAVDVVPDDTATVSVRLQKITTLDVVRVTASRRGRMLATEIDERRRTGEGYLLDADQIVNRLTFSSVFNDFPSARVERRTGDFIILFPDGRGGECLADVWVDGTRSVQEALNAIQPREVAAVEVFPRVGAVPVRFRRDIGSHRGCGAVLVWTNWALGR